MYGEKPPGLREKVIKLSEQAGIAPQVGGLCPCGEVFAASLDSYAVAHSFPVCKEFEDKEPAEYLRFIQMKFVN